MNKSAVDRLGVQLLEGLNTGSAPTASGGGDGFTVYVRGISVEEWKHNVAHVIPMIMSEGGKASRMLR